MNTIYFIGSTNNIYGRGKDKTKRKSRVGLLSGAAIGALSAGGNIPSTLGRVALGAGTGMLVDKGIDKEKERYKKEGARTRFGKIINDAKVGAKSAGAISGGLGGIGGSVIGAATGSNTKSRIAQGIAGGLLGAGITGASGALTGGSWGAGVGVTRGFLQPNKKKK